LPTYNTALQLDSERLCYMISAHITSFSSLPPSLVYSTALQLVPSDMQQQIHEYCSLNSDNTMNTWPTNNVIM